MRGLTFIKRAAIGYAVAFAVTIVLCIMVSVVTDFGEYITWREQLAIMLKACLQSGLWGFAYPFIMIMMEIGKTRFKNLKSIKDHFDIDYPDKPE